MTLCWLWCKGRKGIDISFFFHISISKLSKQTPYDVAKEEYGRSFDETFTRKGKEIAEKVCESQSML